jgi:hypothetical protein
MRNTPFDCEATPVVGQSAARATPEVFDVWLDDIRSKLDDDNDCNEPVDRSPVIFGSLLALIVAVLGGAVVLIEIVHGPYPPTSDLRGRIVDVHQQAVVGARVFLAADPQVCAITDRLGWFYLREVPAGPRSIVAVLEDVGEEYRASPSAEALIDMGTRIYHVPPLQVRMGPGAGADWPAGGGRQSKPTRPIDAK